MNIEVLQILKKHFGYDNFKTGQEQVIDTIRDGQDVLAIMPTGAGKSICYQVPALLFEGITLVISPLISLMQDQVKSLNEAGIHAAYINSSLSEMQISKALQNARRGHYKIIYVAPERLESAEFVEFAVNIRISMVTIDEAHCISQWGQDFRPSYLKIADFIGKLPIRPVVSAFTATATKEVKEDIVQLLALWNSKVVVTGFDRENLYYRVEHISQKAEFVLEYIIKHSQESGIIYCATRKNVDALYELLYAKGIAVTRYHAGLGTEERKRNQDDFIYDRTPIIVATNAFGMGIDKSNVRYVIHYNMPQSMENYYQEAGRAGRDGETAQCILLFSAQDVMINKFLLEKKDFTDVAPENVEEVRRRDIKRLRAIENYCKTTACLRNYILDYFGECTVEPCDHCGNCHRVFYENDMTMQAKWVINCVHETKGRFGIGVVMDILRGSANARMQEIGAMEYKSYSVLSDCKKQQLRLLIGQMLMDGYLIQTEDIYGVLKMGPEINRLREENTHVLVRMYEEKKAVVKKEKTAKKKGTDELTPIGLLLFDKLRTLRLKIAREESMPPYIIFSDKSLMDMCVKLPRTKAEMLDVNGVGERKYEKYGRRFLDIIVAYVQEHQGEVFSESVEDTKHENIVKTERRSKKPEFYITAQQAELFKYQDMYYISEIKEQLNLICDNTVVKKVSNRAIWELLVSMELVVEENRDGTFVKNRTNRGVDAGIEVEYKVGKSGQPYELLRYPPFVQRIIVDSFVQ